jgi:MoxR-like ATPase
MNEIHTLIDQILEQTQRVILDKEIQIKLALSAFLSSSHVLIEDIPGVGKTTLAKILSKVLGLDYARMQFTSDLLPSDIIGVNFYNTKDGKFEFKKGAIFCEFFLADEINRASAKTQSALLEAMEEKQVSIDAKTYKLPLDFFVIATKNPNEEIGTFELPSSQLDRFAISFSLGYPSFEAQRAMLKGENKIDLDSLKQLDKDNLYKLKDACQNVYVDDEILDLIQNILNFTRESKLYKNGLSPRAALNIVNISKAWALISKRDFVIPDDILEILPFIVHHRLVALGVKKDTKDIVDEIFKNINIST